MSWKESINPKARSPRLVYRSLCLRPETEDRVFLGNPFIAVT